MGKSKLLTLKLLSILQGKCNIRGGVPKNYQILSNYKVGECQKCTVIVLRAKFDNNNTFTLIGGLKQVENTNCNC